MKKCLKYMCVLTAFSGLISCTGILDINDYQNYAPDNTWNDEKLSDAENG